MTTTTVVARGVRDAWLRATDAGLLRQCREERYKSSGPGGQRKNKVTTAVRLRHEPSGVTVQAEEFRFLEDNRRRALKRLRERIAIEVREPFDPAAPALPPELARYVRDGRLAVNPKNPHYPLVLASALDALAAAGWRYAPAAAALGVTTSQLLKLLESGREAWRWILERRVRQVE
jgi:hypothetical protein